MASTPTQKMWLHDKDKTFTIIPYTTLDNIKIQSGNSFSDFEDDYNELKTTVNGHTSSVNLHNNSIQTLNSKVALLEQSNANIQPYNLPTASTTTKGGVKVDGTTIVINDEVISAVGGIGGGGGSSTLAGLNDVDLNDLNNGDVLAWDAENSKFINLSMNNIKEKKSQIPTMTSNTTPSGTVSASSFFQNGGYYLPYMAFNGQSANMNSMQYGWLAASSDNSPWLMYQFENAVTFDELFIETANNSTTTIRTFYIEGSNDGETWTNVLKSDSTTDLQFVNRQYKEYEIKLNGENYSYLRLRTTQALYGGPNQYACSFSKIQLYTVINTIGNISNNTQTALFKSSTNHTSNIIMSNDQSMFDFDAIIIEATWVESSQNANYECTSFYLTQSDYFVDGKKVGCSHDTGYIWYQISSRGTALNFVSRDNTNKFFISGVYGINLFNNSNIESNLLENLNINSYSETTLYEGTEILSTITLNDTFGNYDALEFITGFIYQGRTYKISNIILKSDLNDLLENQEWITMGYSANNYCFGQVTANNTFSQCYGLGNLYCIKGINFGSNNTGSGYSKTLVYSSESTINGAPINTNNSFLHPIENYDFLLLEYSSVGDNGINDFHGQSFIDASSAINTKVCIPGYKERVMVIAFTNTTFNYTTTVTNENANRVYQIYKIYGIKFGGKRSNYSRTSLYQNNSNTTTGVITLSDDITNYKRLEFITKTTNDGASWSNTIDTSVLINRFPYVNNPDIYTTNYTLSPYINVYIKLLCGEVSNQLYIFNVTNLNILEIAGLNY